MNIFTYGPFKQQTTKLQSMLRINSPLMWTLIFIFIVIIIGVNGPLLYVNMDSLKSIFNEPKEC